MNTHNTNIEQLEKASEFIYKGLNTKLTPQKDSDYKKLVAKWDGSESFRDTVHAIAKGLKLKVVSVSYDAGAIVLPKNHNSLFSYGGLTIIKKSLKISGDDNVAKRGTLVLGIITILASFFRDEHQFLEYREGQHTQSLTKITRLLVEICKSLKDQYQEDKEDIPEYLREGWEIILRLSRVKEGQPGLNSIEGIIEILIGQLVKEGLLVEDVNSINGKAWFPTKRFIAQAERDTTTNIYGYCMEIHHNQVNKKNKEVDLS